MSFIGKTLGKIVGSVTGSTAQAEAATQAAAVQDASARYAVDSNNAQFQQIQQLLSPFVNSGVQALGQQGNLLGLNGAGAQQAAYAGIQNSPAYQALLQSGQTGILQNAAATGGLRGGNTQGALAQFSPQILAQLIQQQYGNLGGLTSLGQNAAAGTGNAGMSTAANNAQLMQQSGAAQAGGIIAAGNAGANNFRSLTQLGGVIGGLF